jgi:hypothetical protein
MKKALFIFKLYTAFIPAEKHKATITITGSGFHGMLYR